MAKGNRLIKRQNLSGKVFRKWLVLSYSHTDIFGQAMWKCLCTKCRIEKSVITTSALKNGKSSMCVKCRISGRKTHGLTGTKLYNTFSAMKSRCKNRKNASYHRYGGRGIQVLWDCFQSFKDDMEKSFLEHVNEFGEKNTTIDRVDNDGPYSKENCRWVTILEQASNKSNVKKVFYNGEELTISEISLKYSVPKYIITSRLKYGWPIERSIEAPVRGSQIRF